MNFKYFILGFFLLASYVNAEVFIAVAGDSVSGGLPMGLEKSWMTLLEKELDIKIFQMNTGNKSSSAYPCIENFIKNNMKPDIFIIALGINDCLEFCDQNQVFANINNTIALARKANIKTFVGNIDMCGFGEPKEHYNEFKLIYYFLKLQNPDVTFFDYVTPEITWNPIYNIGDHVHPNEEGQKLIKTRIKEILLSLRIE